MVGKLASYYVAAKTNLEDNVRKWGHQFIEDVCPEMEGVDIVGIDRINNKAIIGECKFNFLYLFHKKHFCHLNH